MSTKTHIADGSFAQCDTTFRSGLLLTTVASGRPTCKRCLRWLEKVGDPVVLETVGGVPHVPVYRFTAHNVEVRCPHCWATHMHGKGPGHRVSHCGTVPPNPGYVIVFPAIASVPETPA